MAVKRAKLNFRTVFWGAAGLVVILLLAYAFWPRPVLADMAQIEQGALTVAVRDEGRTRVREVYTVSAPLAGRLLRVGNRAGETVGAGELVASILPGDPVLLDARTRREAEAMVEAARSALLFARAEADRAEAQAVHARAEADRAERLFARDAISQSGLDRARLERRSATAALATAQAGIALREAELQAARVRLMDPDANGAGAVVEIRAPVSGRVLRVMQQSESVVAPGAPILEIGDPRDLEVIAEFLSGDAVRISEGADARIDAWGGGPPLRGRVRLVEPFGFLKISALGVEEQRVNVIIDLLDPPEDWAALGHGYRVEAAATVWEGEDVVKAPVGALFRERGGWAVFVVENGRARLRPVEAGRNDGIMAQIVSGLERGDSVILHPGRALSDGTRVRRRDA